MTVLATTTTIQKPTASTSFRIADWGATTSDGQPFYPTWMTPEDFEKMITNSFNESKMGRGVSGKYLLKKYADKH